MKKNKHFLQWTIFGLILVGLLAFLFWPTNKFIETPGGASSLKSFVSIKDNSDTQKGSYMITYVQIQKATPIGLLKAKFDPHADIENAQDIMGGVDNDTYNKVQKFYMQNAINEAVAVGAKAAKIPVKANYVGIFITDISDKSKFKGALKVGDTVTKVDDKHFNNSLGYQQYLASKKPNDSVKITYLRNNKQQNVTRKLIDIGKRAGLGIVLGDNVQIKTNPKIDINPGDIGGPSGGLMFSLQVYNQLTNSDMRDGRKIAGTGTINLNGDVGEIGGIDKKIIAAKKAGATVFFAPYVDVSKIDKKYLNGPTNYQLAKKTAKKYAPNIKVVPVSNFDDALKYLQKTK